MTDDIQVKIANASLVKIAKDPINSLSDNTEEAIWVNRLWDEVREDVISDGPWGFATKRATLAYLDESPVYEFDYAYQLPTDCLVVIGCNNEDIQYRQEGSTLVADSDTLSIKYLFNNTNTATWPATFKRCFKLKLAAELAYQFKRDLNLKQSLQLEYEMALQKGLARDGQQGSKDYIRVSSFTDEVRS